MIDNITEISKKWTSKDFCSSNIYCLPIMYVWWFELAIKNTSSINTFEVILWCVGVTLLMLWLHFQLMFNTSAWGCVRISRENEVKSIILCLGSSLFVPYILKLYIKSSPLHYKLTKLIHDAKFSKLCQFY